MSNQPQELSPKAEFLFVASVKVALELIDAGKSKADYLYWCMEIWQTIEKNGINKMRRVVDGKMASDIEKILKQMEKGV